MLKFLHIPFLLQSPTVTIAHFACVGVSKPNKKKLHNTEDDVSVTVLPWGKGTLWSCLGCMRKSYCGT